VSGQNSTLDLFAKRCTVRRYRPEPLAAGDLKRIMEAGQCAPTGASGQIYSVVRITDRALRDRLAALSGDQQHIRDAAEFFIFCIDVYRTQRLLQHRGETFGAEPAVSILYGTMDALLVAANLATSAEALGYGTCFIGAVLNHLDTVAHDLQLPPGVLPIVGLTIGVPSADHTPLRKPRLPPELIFHENHYCAPCPADLEAAFQAMGDDWCGTLQRFFGPGGRLAQREPVWRRTLIQQGLLRTEGETTDD
jgi:FMN reductase (NADPH)